MPPAFVIWQEPARTNRNSSATQRGIAAHCPTLNVALHQKAGTDRSEEVSNEGTRARGLKSTFILRHNVQNIQRDLQPSDSLAQTRNMLTCDPHPLLDVKVFRSTFPKPIGELTFDPSTWFSLDGPAPLKTNDKVRSAVRDLLRQGGFKPTGRSKPASEYLVKAVTNDKLTSINTAVDVCNVVSLHSGLPISVVDLDRVTPPLRIGIAPDETSFIFNASGQTIKLAGLLCLFDADGACANAVKDSQRTKTDDNSTQTLTVIWGTNELPGRAQAAMDWYSELLSRINASTTMVH